MHYIKCGVNNSLHNSGCCIRSLAPWITVLSWHTVFTKRVIYYKFSFVWYSAKQDTTHRPTLHLVHCALSLATRRTQMAEQLGWFRWPLFVMATAAAAAAAAAAAPTALFRLLCMTRHRFRNIIPVRYERFLRWQQNRSKAMMCVLYKNSSYSKVSKTLLLDWRLCVVCYYPTNPTDYPITARGMSVGRSVAVNIKFCGYLWFLIISFVWIIWVHYATDNLSGQQLEFAS